MRFVLLVLLATLGGGCRCGAKPRPTEGQPEPPPRPARPTAARPLTVPPPALPRQRPAPVVVTPPQVSPRSAPPPGPVEIKPGTGPEPANAVAVPPGLRLRSGHLDIDVHRADVRALLQAIARATRTNLILHADVQGKVTVQLRNQPVGTALEVVARAVGCRVTEAGHMLIVRRK